MARASRSADEQFPRDYRISQPTGDKPGDLKLTRGQGTLILALVQCGLSRSSFDDFGIGQTDEWTALAGIVHMDDSGQ